MTPDGRDPENGSGDLRDAFRCLSCGERWYYARNRCPACGAGPDERETYRLGVGVLEATTVAAVTPPDVRSDNALGLARFDGVGLVAQLADDSLAVGDAVRLEGSYALRGGREGSEGEGGEDDEGGEAEGDAEDGTIRGPRLEPAPDPE